MKQTLRSLLRSPGFTAASVTSVALGIGLACSVYAIARASLFAPIPYPEVDELVELWPTARPGSDQPIDYLTSERMLEWAGSEMRFLDGVAGRGMAGPLILRLPDGARRVASEPIVGDWFGTLGVDASRGRVLVPSDLLPGAEPAAVVSEAMWRNILGADQAYPGATVVLSETTFTVVGIMPRSFEAEEKVWVSADALPSGRRPAAYGGVARLRSGATIAEATGEIALLAAAQVAADSARFGGFGATARPFGAFGRSAGGPGLWMLVGVAGAVLLVVLSNLTHLFLVRAQSLDASLAIRTSLGAGAWQLGRVLVAEAAFVAATGGVVGLLLAVVGRNLIRGLLPGPVGATEPVIDLGVAALAVALTLVVGGVVAFEPLRRLGRISPAASLLHRGAPSAIATRRERRTRNLLVATQVATSVVLVTAMFVLQSTWRRFVALDVGYDADRVVVARPDWQIERTPPVEQWALARRVAIRLTARPEVEAVAVWRHIHESYPPRPEFDATFDGPPRELGVLDGLYSNVEVEPGTIEALGIESIRGRTITAEDTPGTPAVAVITQTGADAWWPGDDPLGHQIKLGQAGTWLTVVGVVEDIESLGVLGRATATRTVARGTFQPVLFTAARQGLGIPPGWFAEGDCYLCYGVMLGARTMTSPAAAGVAVREEVADAAPTLPLLELGTFYDAQLSGYYREAMLLPGRLAAMGLGVALLLALVGVVGIVTEGVARRSRELGIRIALGARPDHVLGIAAKEGLLTGTAGAITGLAAAVWLHRTFAPTLFNYMAMRLGADSLSIPMLLVATVPLVLVIGAVTVVAAVRALSVDPAEVLRSQ